MCSIARSLELLETFYDLNDVTTDNGNCRQSQVSDKFVVISGIPLLYWHSMQRTEARYVALEYTVQDIM